MEFLEELIAQASHGLRHYNSQIAMAMAATIFFIYGGGIHTFIRKTMAAYHFVVRLAIFAIICAFGYGLITVYSAKLIAFLLQQLTDLYYVPLVLAVFLLVGFLADLKKKM